MSAALIDWLRSRWRTRSEFSRNAAWFTGLNLIERVLAVIQTVVLARLLGITDYGVYGFLMGTIGLAASIAGLQMGLTATVFVARYRLPAPAKAAAVITMTARFGWLVGLTCIALASPFLDVLARHLLGTPEYRTAVLLGVLLVAAAVGTGVQEGIAQGFELFRALARTKVTCALLALMAIFPLAETWGVAGVMAAALVAAILRFLLLAKAIRQATSEFAVPRQGSGVSWRVLLSDFAVPSTAASIAVGTVSWFGTYLLTRQAGGFNEVAIANTGLQWRGPILLLAASLGGVAIPAFSRLDGDRNASAVSRLRHRLILTNAALSIPGAITLAAGSGLILAAYGHEFAGGRMAFALVVASAAPSVMANVYLQEMVGKGRMWRQLLLYGPHVLVLWTSFVILVPRYLAIGYGASLLAGSVALLATVIIADKVDRGAFGGVRDT